MKRQMNFPVGKDIIKVLEYDQNPRGIVIAGGKIRSNGICSDDLRKHRAPDENKT